MSERTDRYEEQIANVVGQARRVCAAWVKTEQPGVVKTVTLLEMELMQLHHDIGVLDADGIEPDDE